MFPSERHIFTITKTFQQTCVYFFLIEKCTALELECIFRKSILTTFLQSLCPPVETFIPAGSLWLYCIKQTLTQQQHSKRHTGSVKKAERKEEEEQAKKSCGGCEWVVASWLFKHQGWHYIHLSAKLKTMTTHVSFMISVVGKSSESPEHKGAHLHVGPWTCARRACCVVFYNSTPGMNQISMLLTLTCTIHNARLCTKPALHGP